MANSAPLLCERSATSDSVFSSGTDTTCSTQGFVNFFIDLTEKINRAQYRRSPRRPISHGSLELCNVDKKHLRLRKSAVFFFGYRFLASLTFARACADAFRRYPDRRIDTAERPGDES